MLAVISRFFAGKAVPVAIAGWSVSLILGGMLLNAHTRIGSERQKCNAEKLLSVVEAQQAVREQELTAEYRRTAELARQLDAARHAEEVAKEAEYLARNQLQETIRAVRNQPRIDDASKCLDQPVPDDILDRLRRNEGG